jgi:hypothetical protein
MLLEKEGGMTTDHNRLHFPSFLFGVLCSAAGIWCAVAVLSIIFGW